MNSDFNVLVTSHVQGIVQFHSIADVENIYSFKEFKLLEKGLVDQVLFSSNCNEVAAISIENKRLFYILTDLKSDFEVLGYVNLPYTPVVMCWDKTTKLPIKPKY